MCKAVHKARQVKVRLGGQRDSNRVQRLRNSTLYGANQVKKYYTWSAAVHLESIEKAGTLYYPVRNGQGDIVTVLDEAGNTVASYTYDAFGNLVNSSGQTEIKIFLMIDLGVIC